MSICGFNKNLKYLFGPVISRRLGTSLGVDLVAAKTCQLNCIYCEAGTTTNLTLNRREFFPLDDIKAELDAYLAENPEVDYITFSGAGEPTLYLRLGELIDWLKEKYRKQKICLLTNGILIGQGGMPEELKNLDLIVPSLDASTEETFRKINRPANGLTLTMLVHSIKTFRERNKCSMWLEIFIVPGINDNDDEIAKFAKIVSEIKPDKIQLNGLDRPGVEKFITKPSPETLDKFTKALSSVALVESIVRQNLSAKIANPLSDKIDSITKLVERRPCTIQEIKKIYGFDEESLDKIISEFLQSGKFILEKTENGIFLNLKGKK